MNVYLGYTFSKLRLHRLSLFSFSYIASNMSYYMHYILSEFRMILPWIPELKRGQNRSQRESQAYAVSPYGSVNLTAAQSLKARTPPQVGAFPHGI